MSNQIIRFSPAKAEQWFKNGIGLPKCPVCAKNDWTIYHNLVGINEFMDLKMNSVDGTFSSSLVQLTCKTCCHVILFFANQMGILK